jgi:dTDP-4-amino-4,6-dideoxygalactose transaminase
MRFKSLRNHGITHGPGASKYISQCLGYNFRMSEISAAIGIVQLRYLDRWIDQRRKIATKYQGFLPVGLVLPVEYPERKHVFHLYVIRTLEREKMIDNLRQYGIETGIHYPIPIHRQPPFSTAYNLSNTDRFCQQIVSLPMFPDLSDEQIKYICQKINQQLAIKNNRQK